MSVTVNNLSKQFGTRQVLKNIHFSIDEGEIVGFLGPNGAGKTTTMRIITGALPYVEGSVKVCGLEVSENPLEIKELIGYLPEQNPLYPDMYVREYLNFVSSTYRLGKNGIKRVNELIDAVGLQTECTKKIGQLSKGYRQRVGIAQALIPDPKVLILDEPTNGLDPNQLTEIRDLIKQNGENRTVIFSSHILQEVEAVCNRVIIINKGEIVADFPDMNGITDFGASDFHFEVEFLYPIKNEKWNEFSQISRIETNDNLRFDLISKSDIRSEIFDFAVKNSNKIVMMKPLEKRMEEVFRELTTI